MKKAFLLLLFMTSIIGYSQIPAYYNDVNLNLSGQALKNELATKIINTHTTNLTYTPGVWDALKQTDLDPTDPTKVLLIYGWDDTDSDITNDRSRGKDMNGGNVGDWNREHVYPKSLGIPNLGTEGPGADAHSLRPCDGQRNSSRNNRMFAAGTGNSGATAQGDWYPGDEWKGDVARMMMYMYIRYGDRTLPINVGVGNPVAGDANMIDLFLQWNAEDPVSDLEKQRNPVLETLQGNRNPFVDNPAFATQVWGGPQAEDLFNTGGGTDTEVPTMPTNLVASNIATFSANLSWTASTDNVGVTAYNIYKDGVFLVSNTSTSYNATGLSPNTSYAFYVEARDAAGNISAASNTVNFTTQDVLPGGDASDLFFSEYIEGSSFNKALEIVNVTGAPVNLSAYTIKKQTNGAGAWSGGLSLAGTLVSGDVYVVANSSANTTILNVADIFTGSTEVTFNGNDAVGLFKNDVLIDIIGTFDGGTANFAQNTTLVRQPTVSSPSTTYLVAEWNSFPSDTFTDLGIHTFNGGGPGPDTQAPTVPASLVAANVTDTSADLSWTASTDNVGVTGYDIYQDGVLLASTTTATNYNVTGLTAETAYAFTVTANDAAGNTSVASNAANVTTTASPDTQAPTAPASLVAANITDTSADLSWTVSADNVGVTGYDIYQDGVLLASTTTATNYNVTGLTAETAYAFTVTANDAAGNTSVASNAANVTTTASPDTQAPTAPASLVAANITDTSADLSWTVSTDNVGVTGYDIYQDGVLLASTTTATNYIVTGLTAETAYAFTVTANDIAGNTSVASNVANVTTTAAPSGGNATDLFFSEYIEGSSFNKALEIANFTNAPVDLSIYTIKKQTNGAGTWSGGLSLSGTLANGAVYIVGHNSSTTAIQNVSNVLTASAEITFNGNDAVGLFKNGVLIDIIGTFNGGTTNFAKDVTLIRKASIGSPSSTYVIAEWDSFATDTFSFIGTHIFTSGTPDTEVPTTPASLVASNITHNSADLSWIASTDNVGVTGYDIYQDGVLLASTTTVTSYSVTGLTSETAYTFSVIANDAAGNASAASNIANVTTIAAPDTQAPTAPASLAALNITETSADLSWTASTDNVGVTSYDVYQDGVFLSSTATTNYSVIGLTAQTTYIFEVIANDAANNQSLPSTINVVTLGSSTGSTAVLHEGFFENGFDGWIDGGSDCNRYSGARSFEGNYSIRLRDNSGAASSMTLENVDVTGYDTVEVEFHFYSYSMENNEDFWLRYHDGSSWITVATYARGTDFENNNFYSAIVTLDKASYNFANNAKFRFQNDASGNGDHIYIDQVSIKGITNGAGARDLIASKEAFSKVQYIKSLNEVELDSEEDFIIGANPVVGNRLQVKFFGEGTPSFRVINLLGQIVKVGNLTEELINIDNLGTGIYIFELNDGDEVMTKKFIKN